MVIVPNPRTLILSKDFYQGDRETVEKVTEDALPYEHYQIHITPTAITLKSGSDAGFFYAEKTLEQIFLQNETALPCLTIEDSPDFESRGFMLDISRCQVPTLKSIFDLIDTLATLKINQLQLYTEHTFAYKGHELVWGDASPLTAEDIQAIDTYCKDNFIDLVPNQNSLGHMERWLKYPEYCFLAECPQGFVHPISGKQCSPSVLKPNAESLAFLKKLYAELLPNFSSPLFHVGLDEPWELGQGWSKAMVEAEGKNEVFLRYVHDVHNLLQPHNKQMLFWADVMMEKPESANQLPPSATPVIWGYEADSPFTEQCQTLASLQRNFYVAPGTSTWNSFSGRLDNALSNLKNAAAAGLRHKAQGYLITSWGDQGNHQPWAILYPPLLQGAASAWNEGGNRELDIETALNRIVYRDATDNIGKALCQLGRIENDFSGKLFNQSFNHCFFFGSDQQVEEALNKISPAEMSAQTELLDSIDEQLENAQLTSKHINTTKEDIRLATDMIRWANQRALSTLPSSESPYLRAELKQLIGRYKERWLRRNRPGGLHESTNYLRSLL